MAKPTKMHTIICTVSNELTYDQRMIRICTSLSKAGYKVMLVGRRRSSPLLPRPYLQKRIHCLFNKGKLFYLEYNIRLFFFLLFSSFDIICSIDLDTILPGFWVSKLKGKICVYDAHEYFTEVPELVRRPLVKKLWEGVAAYCIPQLKYCYTVGEKLAGIFEERFDTSFEVIRNVPYKNEEVALPGRESKTILLYQGALNEGRGLEQAIAAMQEIKNAELWLAGEGDLSAALRELVNSLKVDQKVHFLGYLQPEDLMQVGLQADIGLNLLQNWGLSYYYSLANKAFDYIQAGLPSINMDFPEYCKLNEQYETFFLVKDIDPKTIVSAVNILIGNKALYAKLRENCLKAKPILCWENEEEKLLGFYEKLKDKL